MKIYVASSWRNNIQPGVVEALRSAGHEVYDFKNPPGRTGFSWSEISQSWEQWTTPQYIAALEHPASLAGYKSDMDAMIWADACVLVLPCGRSAHTEAGWFSGAGKPVCAFIPTQGEPELMYKMFDHITESLPDVVKWADITDWNLTTVNDDLSTSSTVSQKTWDLFRGTGLFYFINCMLHAFGWALVAEVEEGQTIRVWPARVKYRGFPEKETEEEHEKIGKYLGRMGAELAREVSE